MPCDAAGNIVERLKSHICILRVRVLLQRQSLYKSIRIPLSQSRTAAAKAANLGDDWQIDEYPRRRSFEEQILSRFSSRILTSIVPSAEVQTDPLSVKVQQFREDWDTLRSLNDPLGMYSRLPFTPTID